VNILQYSMDALSLGGLYALAALGIGLIFGVMRLINFAHGELITACGYSLLLLASAWEPLMVLGALAIVVVLALAMERVAFRPLRDVDPATMLIASFAVSFFIQKVLFLLVGGRAKGVDLFPELSVSVSFLGLRAELLQLVTVGSVIVLLVALVLFLRNTRFGIVMRAAAEDFRMARLLGVRANQVIAVAFAISGILATAVGVLFVAQTGSLTPRMGVPLVIIAFVSTVIGGLGSLSGAAVGGFLVGVTSVGLEASLPPGWRAFREAFVFGLVIVILLFRPQGLLPAPGYRERI
jgi:branched-chain amino acid transport system permease protein